MSFIPDDCHNIVMDVPPTGPDRFVPRFVARCLSAGDLRSYADAGARVALEFVPWHIVEPSAGACDWAMPDDMVARCRRAGLRVLLMAPTTVPLWCPDEWYVWDIDGRPMRDHDRRNPQQTWGCLSPWNEDAMGCYIGFVRRVQARYCSDDVQVIQCFSQEGEALLPPAIPCIYDPAAVASYRAHVGNPRALPAFGTRSVFEWMHATLTRRVVELQRVYADTPWRECWSALHPVYYGPAWGASGVIDIPAVWREVLREVDPVSAHHIAFDFFPRSRQREEFEPLMQALREMGVSLWAGSDWPEGLRTNTRRAVDLGLRGLITAPLHPYQMKTQPEPWVPDAFRESAELFRGAL